MALPPEPVPREPANEPPDDDPDGKAGEPTTNVKKADLVPKQ